MLPTTSISPRAGELEAPARAAGRRHAVPRHRAAVGRDGGVHEDLVGRRHMHEAAGAALHGVGHERVRRGPARGEDLPGRVIDRPERRRDVDVAALAAVRSGHRRVRHAVRVDGPGDDDARRADRQLAARPAVRGAVRARRPDGPAHVHGAVRRDQLDVRHGGAAVPGLERAAHDDVPVVRLHDDGRGRVGRDVAGDLDVAAEGRGGVHDRGGRGQRKQRGLRRQRRGDGKQRGAAHRHEARGDDLELAARAAQAVEARVRGGGPAGHEGREGRDHRLHRNGHDGGILVAARDGQEEQGRGGKTAGAHQGNPQK